MDVPASPDAPEVRPPRLLNELRPRDGQNDEEHDEVVPGGVVVSGPGSRPLWSKQTSNTLLKRLQASAGFLAGKENASVSGKRKIKRKLIMDYDDLFRMEAGSIKHRKTSFACMSSSSSSTTTSSVSGVKASPKRSSRASAAKSNCCQNQKPSRTGGKSVAAIKPRNSHYDAKKKGFVKMEATSGSKIKSKKTPSTNAKKSGEAVPVSTITKVASVSEKGVYVGNRRYYHVRCNQIMSEGQVDDWDDFNWLLELSLRQIDDFLDVNEGEKTFFKLWNEHVFQMPCYGDAMMPECLDRFVDNYAVRIHRLNVYRNFLLHLSNLYDFGVISQATVLATILRLQNLIKNLMLHAEQQQLPPPILYPVVLSTPYVRHDHEPAIPNLLDDDDDGDGDCGGRDQPQKHIYQNHEAGSPSGSRSGSPHHHHHNNNNNNISIKSLDSDRIVPMLTPSGPIASTSSFSSSASSTSSSSSSWSASSSGLACSKSSGPDSRRQQKTFWRCGRGSLINSSSSSLAAASSSESGSCSKKKRKVEDLELLLDEVKYRRKRVCVSFAPAQQTPPIRDLHSDSSSWSSSWSWDSPYVRPCVRFSSGSKKRCSL